ncbi:MAG: sugar ABC transporter permease [Thermomicrobiales bacterium]
MTQSTTLVRTDIHEPQLRFWQRVTWRRKVVPWLFVLPILLINLIVVLGPAMAAFYYSLTEWNGIGTPRWIGLDNYRRMLTDDPSFVHAFRNNLLWLVFFLTIPMAMALIAASLLSPLKRGGLTFRLGLFLPYVLPSVVVAAIWRSLLHPDRGIPGKLTEWGVPGFDRALLGDASTVLPTIAFVDNWHFWGFLMVLFLAAMQNIPADLYEAARLDGASKIQEFRDITIPGIRPTLVFMVLMTSIWSFLTFDYIWVLTQGGPAGSSEVLSVLVFKNAFMNLQAGYASAIGLSMSALVGVVIGIFILLRKRGWEI